jgi:hypothetical protein
MSGRRLFALGSAAFGMFAASLQAQTVRTADSLLHQGVLQRAEAEYYAASRIHPRDPSARFALGKYLLDLIHTFLGTCDVYSVGPEVDHHLQAIFHKAKVFVAGPVQGLNTRRDLKGFFNQAFV